MNKATIWGSILLLGIGSAARGQMEEIARWNSAGSVPLAGTFAPMSQNSNVVVSNLVAGTALLRTGSSPAANTFAAAGYSAASSNAAMSAGHYWQTMIQANPGYALSYDQIAYSFRRASSGPPLAQWAYSTNGTTFVWLQPAGSNSTSYNSKQLSLTEVAALQYATNKIWFRMYAWLGGTANTSWGVFGQNADVLTFSGTVISLSGEPVISFNPSTDVQVHVSNTLDVAISVLPLGSGVQQWTVEPTPAGATSLSGGAFHFTPVAADENVLFTLSVVATNAYGTTTNALAIAVTEYLPPGTLEITFDNAGEVKTSYDLGAVTLSGQAWILDQAIIGDSASDLKVGARAARFGKYYQATMTSSNKLLGTGMGTLSFLYAQYGGDDAGAELVVEVAETTDGDWLEVGRVDADGVTTLTEYETTIGISQPAYLRIRTEFTEGVGQVNVDNIVITPYAAPSYSAYEQYLLQYNVTPGDAGTAPGEDWDGDHVSNSNEFMALPQTNPYDPASVP